MMDRHYKPCKEGNLSIENHRWECKGTKPKEPQRNEYEANGGQGPRSPL